MLSRVGESGARYRKFGRGKRSWRSPVAWVSALAVGLLVASGITLPAPPAQAALHNLFPADVDGFPKDRFRADEALFVTMTSDTEGGTVCVVPASVTDPTTVDCTEPAWGNAKTYVGMGTMLGYPFFGGSKNMLRPGEWRLLATPIPAPPEEDLVSQAEIRLGLNGKKPLKGVELSEAFTVVSCSPNCNPDVADAQLAPWKAMATKAVPNAASEQRAVAIDIATRTYKIAEGIYGGMGLGLAGAVIGGGWAALNFDFVIPSTEDLAKRLHKRLASDVRAMWGGIAADPPDPNFDTVAEPEFETLDPVVADATTSETDAAYLNAWFDAQMRAGAYGTASRIASERYQGAVEAGNHEKAALQAAAAADYSFELRNELWNMKLFGTYVAELDWAAAPVVTAPDGEDPATWWAGMLADLERLAPGDITEDDRQALRNQGLSDADIETIIALISDPNWLEEVRAVDPTATIGSVVLASIAQVDEQLEALAQFGSWMSLNQADEQAQVPPEPENQPPVSSFTASVLSGQAPLEVVFTSTATDPEGGALSLRWDIAGARFVDDEETVTHTFTSPGEHWVSLVATDPEGEWHQAIQKVTVFPSGGNPDNRAPVASFTPQTVDRDGPFEQTFTSTSTDPDDDTLSHTWYFGDGTSYTGETVTKTFEAGYLMSVLLVVSDGQLSSQVAGEVTSRGGSANRPPTVAFDLDADIGEAPHEVKATSTSSDPDGDSLSYTWYFGDGGQATGETAEHRYAFPGEYTITLVASDGRASVSAARTVTVTEAVEALGADFSVSRGTDAATALNGAMFLDTGVSQYPGYPVTNLGLPSGQWYSAAGVLDEQTIIVRLAGDGHDLVDRLRLTGAASDDSVKTFSVELTQGDNPYAGYTKVIDRAELARSWESQTFPIAAQTAKFLRLTLHDNHGSRSYFRLDRFEALTPDREGGIVSLDAALGEGVDAKIVDSSGNYPGYLPADALTHPLGRGWIGEAGQLTDQYVTVLLRDGEQHLVNQVTITPGNYRARNVEVQVSEDGTTFDTVATRELLNHADDQAISFAPTHARYVRLMLKNGYHPQYLGVQKLRVFTSERGSGNGVPFIDSSAGTPVSWNWDFGDGASSAEQHPVHDFAAPGVYPVTLTVTDAGGATSTTSGSYTVPSLPTIALTAPSDTVDEGASTLLTASGTGVGQWDWDLGYTKPTGTLATQTARFPDQGQHTATVRGLSADWIWTAPVTKEFTVLNVAPRVSAGSDLTARAGDPLTPAGTSIYDPADQVSCTWDWGDGSAPEVVAGACANASPRVPHIYELPGTYTATLTGDDGDGGVTSDTAVYTILARDTFFQIVRAAAVGDDLQVTARLNDSSTGARIPSEAIELSIDGGTPQPFTADATGNIEAVVAGAAAAEKISLSFAGSVRYLPSALTRDVRAPRADIVFAVDESGSMGGAQSSIRKHLQTIVRGLGDSLSFRVGVVGYADSAQGLERGNVHTPLTDELSEFVRGANGLVASGGSANGYEAIVVGSGYRLEDNDPALGLVESGEMQFQSSAASCMVLISDASVGEVGGAWPKTARAHAEQALAARGTTLFALTADEQATKDAYGPGPGLAGQTGGDWWRIHDFVNNPEQVLQALVEKCVTVATTPDLSVSLSAPATVDGDGQFTATVTATNESSIDTPGVKLTAKIPAGLEFLSASDGGSFDAQTREVTWPATMVLAGGSAPRTIELRAVPGSLDPGVHPFSLSASVGYNGSLGAERTLENNEATTAVSVLVPEPGKVYDVSVTAGVPATVAAGVEAGEEFGYTLTASGNGEENSGVTVLQRVPDRVEIVAVELPQGWENAHGADLVGAHPDGTTDGDWLVLSAQTTDGAPEELRVTARVTPLPGPTVAEDEGALDAKLPALAEAPLEEIVGEVCISADRNENPANDCAALRVPLKEIVAEVTVRLSDGITYLIASVDVTEALAGAPISLSWKPASPLAQPSIFVLNDLEPGTHRIIRWPGASFGQAGELAQWPGWRAVAVTDFDAEGRVLDPVSGQAMDEQQLAAAFRGDRILDPGAAGAQWRLPSVVTFSVNPSVSATVSYREVVPQGPQTPKPGDPQGGTPGGQPGVTPVGTADAPREIATTGFEQGSMQALLWGALVAIALGLLLVRGRRRSGVH